MEEETGRLQLQAKECQGLQEATRRPERGMEEVPPPHELPDGTNPIDSLILNF